MSKEKLNKEIIDKIEYALEERKHKLNPPKTSGERRKKQAIKNRESE